MSERPSLKAQMAANDWHIGINDDEWRSVDYKIYKMADMTDEHLYKAQKLASKKENHKSRLPGLAKEFLNRALNNITKEQINNENQ
jgi:hypothetical protein